MDRLAAPRAVTAQPLATGPIQVTWTSVMGAEGYVISKSAPLAAVRVLSPANPADTVYLDPDVKPGSTYTYAVAAVGGEAGTGPKKAAAPVTATAPTTGGGTTGGGTTTAPTNSAPAPNLPTPSFQVSPYGAVAGLPLPLSTGAYNDAQGQIIRTSLTSLTSADIKLCPLTPMFSFGPDKPAVPAAPFYLTDASTLPAYQKYTWMSGSLYYRPPVAPDGLFPGGLPSPPGAANSWVHVVNCRNEYSNALPFRLEPTALQLTKVNPDGFIGGQQIAVSGTGLEGKKACSSTTWCTPTQKVIMWFRLGKTNAAGTGMDVVERELPAPNLDPPAVNERYVNVFAPSIEAQGYTRATWALLEAKVYVVRDGVRSNALPVRYCSSPEFAARPGACF